jgi:hypothetical protein
MTILFSGFDMKMFTKALIKYLNDFLPSYKNSHQTAILKVDNRYCRRTITKYFWINNKIKKRTNFFFQYQILNLTPWISGLVTASLVRISRSVSAFHFVLNESSIVFFHDHGSESHIIPRLVYLKKSV